MNQTNAVQRRRLVVGLGIGAVLLVVSCGEVGDSSEQAATATAVPQSAATATAVPQSAATATAVPQSAATPELADPPNDAVDEFPAFVEVAVWGNPDGDIRFSGPNGIAVDASDNVYVTEFQGNRVQKFTADGTLLLQWGGEGDENGQLRNPTGIALDSEGNVYVSESGNHRVQKFAADGEWLATWGSHGSGPGEFFSAMVVAVDNNGRVYVSDWGNSRIQVFDTEGTYLQTWGEPGTADGELKNPTGLNRNYPYQAAWVQARHHPRREPS